MKRSFSLFIAVIIAVPLLAQYGIGHRTVSYQDPARSNRNIQSEIYYPAASSGENVAIAVGQFPVIVYGHGFVMGVSSYENIWTTLAPLGYILVFPATEGGTSPSHADFGDDLAFLINKLKTEGINSASPFYNSVGATSAIMGHSMGGGASFLACENNTVPTVMVTYAAANTNPPSIAAAANVSIPALVFAGSDDCVAPPSNHQLLMYNALGSQCKTYISINDGGHCYFANYNLLCTLGEESCSPGGVPLSRSEQQAVTMDFVIPYLDFFLKGNTTSWYTFVDKLDTSGQITYQKSCNINPTTVSEPSISKVSVYYNPAVEQLVVFRSDDSLIRIEITDLTGRIVKKFMTTQPREVINIRELRSGIYMVKTYNPDGKIYTNRFIRF
ncbi:MAG TPA: T9SS type A sorting domain-containing protein [Bacteroidales bacterium]|nr:T9SS type A sorting domain-containing protein [Bacteroidales bacterium]